MRVPVVHWLLPLLLPACHGCESAAPLPESAPALSAAPGYDPDWTKPAASSTSHDPLHGRFSLADATHDLPNEGALEATITTNLGPIRCRLWPDKAPHTVANFVGLANGHRPYRSGSGWEKSPAYDGSSFYRVLPETGIVGGRIHGAGRDSPGYWIDDERWPGMRHDRAGLLCARGSAPNRVGSEFVITTAAAPLLDADAGVARPAYTVFGECTPLALLSKIAGTGDDHGRPRSLVSIERIRVERVGPGTEPASSATSRVPNAAE